MSDEELIEITADNPLIALVGPLFTVPVSGTPAAIVDGVITGFLSASDAIDATEPVAAFKAILSYVGGLPDENGDLRPAGTWLFQLAASALTKALLDQHFLGKRPYLHLVQTNAFHVVRTCVLLPKRVAA